MVRPASRVMWTTGESLSESSAQPDKTGEESLWALPVWRDHREERVFFVLSVISSGKRTALPVRAPTRTHTVMSAPACVSLRMCGAHTCLSEQRKWLTEKNVPNSNFNCQWGKKGEGRQGLGGGCNIYGLCPDEQRRRGLGMKVYSLSQLKSALTWVQPFEVRLAVILKRLVLVSNNGTEWRELFLKSQR